MRFFKIFLIVFFSLVGVIGATYGILLATNYFEGEKVKPKDISFEQTVYNEVGTLDDNGDISFDMTVITSTQDVTEKGITLSFKNQTFPVVNGRISNGIISIPEKARIGEPFKVIVTQDYLEETEGNWNKGGTSTIIAKTDIIGVTQAEATVNIDVPVYAIDVVAKSNGVETNVFSVNSTFTVEPVFTPSASAYMFGGTKTKSVYYAFTTSQGNVNSYIQNLGIIDGKKTFKALMPTDQPITITAYVFNNSQIELDNEALYSNEEDLITQASNQTLGKSDSVNVSFVTQTISGFEISQTNGKQLPFNKTSILYANSEDENDNSLGIRVLTAEQNVDMSYKLADVGIRVLLPQGSKGNEVIISDYSSIVGVTSDGQVVYGEDINQEKDTIYYLPKTNLSDMNKSYWRVAVNNPNVYFNFEVRIFGGDEEFDESFLEQVKQSPTWSTAGIVSTSLNWKNEEPVLLTYEDAVNEEDIIHESYNLFNNIQISQGSYTRVKYIAYTTIADTNVRDMISGLVEEDDSKFDFTTLFQSYGLGTPASCAEIIDSGEFQTKGTGTFNVIAVVIQTDYLGAPILDNNNYQIVAIVKNQDNPLSNQPLEFTITKTLKSLSAHTIASEETFNTVINGLSAEERTNYNLTYAIDGIKNATSSNYNDTYAFTYTSAGLPSFAMEIRFSAGDEEIFVNAWNNNEINVQFTNVNSGLPTNVITYQKLPISSGNIRSIDDNTRAIYVYFTVRSVQQDVVLNFELVYQKTAEKTETIYSTDIETGTTKTFEVYDGKPANIIFGQTQGEEIQTSENKRIQKSIDITGNNKVSDSDDRIIAESIETTYTLQGYTDIKENLFTDGKFNVIVTDKYKQVLYDGVDGSGIVGSAITSDSIDGNYTVTVQTTTKSSTLDNNPSAVLYFTENQGGQVVRIEYYTDADNRVNKKDIPFTDGDQYNSATQIVSMDMLGATGKNISLKGSNSIFVITYALNENQYVLYNVTDFSATTIDNNPTYYQSWVSFNGDGENRSELAIKQNFGTNMTFNIVASVPELFIEQNINFTIKPSIILEDSEITPIQAGAESVGENPLYRGVYSDNQINVKLNFEDLNYVTDLSVRKENGDAFTDGAMTTAIIVEETDSIYLRIYFGADSLGQQAVTIYTGDDNTDNYYGGFKQNLYFNVTPNMQIDNSDSKYTVEADGTINLGTYYLQGNIDGQGKVREEIEIFSSNSTAKFNLIKRLFSSEDEKYLTSFNNIILSFSNVEAVYTNGIFSITNSATLGSYLQINDKITDVVTLELYVLYGTGNNSYLSIGKIKINISANVTAPNIDMGERETLTTTNTNDENITHSAFANYNLATQQNVPHVVLVSGYRYLISDILALFKNEKGEQLTDSSKYKISFATNGNYTIDDTSSYITINSSILNVNQSTLTITQINGTAEIASFTFNVLIIPGSYEFVKYKTSKDEPATSGYQQLVERVNKNIYLLNDMQFLQDEGVYDYYYGGKTVNLYNRFDEYGYGISSFYANKTNFSFKIVNEDGTLNPNAYAVFNSSNGDLTTYTYGTEKFIRIVCYSGASETIIFSYRIKIVPNAELNVYYPYIYGANPTGSNVAEYLEFTPNTDIHLNFETPFAENIPNYREDESGNLVGKRFVLQSEENGEYSDVETSYTLKYSISSLMVGNTPIANNYISGFATISENGELIIKYVANVVLTITVKAEAFMNENSLGASAEYTIIVGYDYETYDFRKANNISTSYSEELIAVYADEESGLYELNLSSDEEYGVQLVSIQGGVATKSNLLNFYYYNESQEGKLEFDSTRTTIKLNEDAQNAGLVSDLTFTLVLYTRYGKNVAYKEIQVVFKSNYSATLNGKAFVLYKENGTNYYTYSDRTIDLKDTEIFNIFKDNNEITIDWANSETKLTALLNGITPPSGYEITMKDGVISLPQLEQERTYVVTLQLILKNTTEEVVDAGEGVDTGEINNAEDSIIAEPFYLTFNLTVYPNVVTKYTIENPYNLGTILANTKDNEVVVQEKKVPSGNANIETSESALFGIIKDGTSFYNEPGEVQVYVEEGISALKTEATSEGTTADEEYTKVDNANNKLIIVTKPVENVTNVLLRVEIEIGNIKYKAYVKFSVDVDTIIETNYPTASSETKTMEYGYLPVDGTYEIDFASQALFAEQPRIVITDKNADNQEIKLPDSRVEIVLGGTNWQNYILVNGAEIASGTSYTLDTTIVNLSWKTETSTLNSITLSFVIKVDGIERETYTVRLDKNMGNVFTYEINYFGDTEVQDNQTTEIFILTDKTDRIFSAEYQLLTFQGKSDLADGTTITAKDFGGNSAEISIDNGATYSNSVTLGSEYRGRTVKLILRFSNLVGSEKPTQRLNLYGSGINSFDYYFTINNNKLFSDIATVGSAEAKTRISLYYVGDLVDYSKYSENLASNNGNMGNITLRLNEATNNSIVFNLGSENVIQNFITYNYKAVFDFKIGSGKSVSQGFMETLYANESSLNILGVTSNNNIWSITKYNGQNYPIDYFKPSENRSINISLFMVTSLEYDYTQFDTQLANNSFPDSGVGDNYIIRYLAGRDSAPVNPPARITNQQAWENDKDAYVYDFNILASGAENEGNYVIYKVTYTIQIGTSTTQEKSEYIMVKILPDWEYTLRNGEGASSTQNSESTPLYIYYGGKLTSTPSDSQVELPLAIARSGDSSRVIFKHTKSSDTSNQATKFTYTLSPSLQNYLTMASTGDNIIQFNKGALTATYGDIEGYIDITDEFNYTVRYYVVLVANEASTSIALIIDSNGNQVQGNTIWEGSSIMICDYKSYQDKTATDKLSFLSQNGADYYILISNYDETYDGAPPPATFTTSYSDGTSVEAIEKVSDNKANFKVMNASFYSGAMSVPLKLQVSLEVTLEDGGKENVLIYTDIYLRQRYTTIISSSDLNNVLDNQDFDVSNFISISDAKIGNNLGTASIGVNDYSIDLSNVNLEDGSLEIMVEIKRQNTASVTGSISVPSSQLNGSDNQAVFLSDFVGFESIDFSQYDPSVKDNYIRIVSMNITGSLNDSNSIIMYTYKDSTSYKIICLNPTNKSFSISALDNNVPVDEESENASGEKVVTTTNQAVTFVYGKASSSEGETTYSYRTISGSKACFKIEFNSNNFIPKNFFEGKTITINSSYGYLPDTLNVSYISSTGGNLDVSASYLSDKILKDKKVLLNTMNVKDTLLDTPVREDYETDEAYNQALANYNNQLEQLSSEYKVNLNLSTASGIKQIEFDLDYDGTQVKSLRQSLSIEDDEIWNIELSDMPLSSEDLLKAKATTIYTDTISLLIPSGLVSTSGLRVPLKISVETNGETITQTPYTLNVTETYEHYIHIPLSTILNKIEFSENEMKAEYKIIVTYDNANSKISYVPYDGKNSIEAVQNSDGSGSTLTIENFKITELGTSDNIASRDKVDIKSVEQINTATKTAKSTILKGYITKFAKSNLYNSNQIGYTVTPNPYGVDTNGNSGTLRYKQIDAASCNPTTENGSTIYTIPVDKWADGYQVVGRGGDVISLLTNYFKQGTTLRNYIFFEINTDESIEGYGAGLATIDEDGNITTDATFDITTNAIVISIRAYIDYDGGQTDKQNSIEVGTIAIVLAENILTAPSVGNYTIQRKSTELDENGEPIQTLYESINYTVATPNDKVIQIDNLFPKREGTWRYNYSLIEILKSGTIINANTQDTSKLDIALRTINDRTTLRNKQIEAKIQAVSKTTGTIIESKDIIFKFDSNGYNLNIGYLDSINGFQDYNPKNSENVIYKVGGNISQYEYDITIDIATIFDNQIITGLNYDYKLIVTNYYSSAGDNIQLDDITISSDGEESLTNQILVFKVDAYGGKNNEDNLLGTKYIGYISYKPVTAGGVVLDLKSAFEEETYYNNSISGVKIKRFETSYTGLVLPIFDDSFASLGFDDNGLTSEVDYSDFITTSVDSGNFEEGKNHSWLLKATKDSTSYSTSYYSLINVKLKYRQSFVFEGIGNFSNSLSPALNDKISVNIDDLIEYRNGKTSNYEYSLMSNVMYSEINGSEKVAPSYIVNVKNNYKFEKDYSYYKLNYANTTENYIVTNNGLISNFNLEKIGKTNLQEIALTDYTNFVDASSGLSFNKGTYYLLDETYDYNDDGSVDYKKARFTRIEEVYSNESNNEIIYQTTANTDFISQNGTEFGKNTTIYSGISINVEANKLYSLIVEPWWTTAYSYYYYFYTANETSVELQVFTPTGGENSDDVGEQTSSALFDENGTYSFIYQTVDVSVSNIGENESYIFIGENEDIISFKQLTAHKASYKDDTGETINEVELEWYYFTGCQGSFITDLSSIQEGTTLNLSDSSCIWEFETADGSSTQYMYITGNSIDLNLIYYNGSSLGYQNGSLKKIAKLSSFEPIDGPFAIITNNTQSTTVNIASIIDVSGFDTYGYRLNVSNLSASSNVSIGTTITLSNGYYKITGSANKYIYIENNDTIIDLDELFGNILAGQTYIITKVETTTNLAVLDGLSSSSYIFFKNNNETDLTYDFTYAEINNGYIILTKDISNCELVGVDPVITLPKAEATYEVTQKDGYTKKIIITKTETGVYQIQLEDETIIDPFKENEDSFEIHLKAVGFDFNFILGTGITTYTIVEKTTQN